MAETSLDLLIVGAGATGTAAAFRAHELGLRYLVVDLDRRLAQLRASAANGNALHETELHESRHPWPRGGELTEALAFAGEVSLSTLTDRWLRVYENAALPCREGLELRGLRVHAEHGIDADLFEHRTRARSVVSTRHVLLSEAPRCGMLRVPGTEIMIGTRYLEPDGYLGAPACVLGGGGASGRAAMEIAAAKHRHHDRSPVHWCFTGEPRFHSPNQLNEALQTGLLHVAAGTATLGISKDADGRVGLLVGNVAPGVMHQPTLVTGHVFDIDRVVAPSCRPSEETDWLEQMGVGLHKVGERRERLPVVDHDFETSWRGLFVAGPALSPSYCVVARHGAGEAPHKVACSDSLRDECWQGAHVAEVVAARRRDDRR